jgi:hypothetical protein
MTGNGSVMFVLRSVVTVGRWIRVGMCCCIVGVRRLGSQRGKVI